MSVAYDISPLMLAVIVCDGTPSSIGAVKVLVDKSESMIKNSKGITALMIAANRCKKTGSIEAMRLLINAGATVDVQDPQEVTRL